MNRVGKQYKAYLDGASPTDHKIPKSTLRRWCLQGRVNVDRLRALGIRTVKKRTPGSEECRQSDRERRLEDLNVPHTSHISLDNQAGGSHSTNLISSDTPCLSSNESGNEAVNSNVDSDSGSSNFSFESDSDSGDTHFSFSDDELNDLCNSNTDLSSILKSNFIGNGALNRPVHPALSVTKFESLLMILHIYMRHKLNDVLLEDLLEFVNQLVGIPDALPVSKRLFHKLFMSGSKPTQHFYCPKCVKYLVCENSFISGSVECINCDWTGTVSSHNEGNYFLTLNLRQQIQEVLNKPGVKFVKQHRTADDVISDVMDGQEYKSLKRSGKILSNTNSLTLTFNTDGAPVFKSGPNSLWPVHCYINEIDPSQRFHAENMLLGALWFGKCEANIQILLEPFIDELKELQNEGVVWRNADGTIVESPVYALLCCTDSVAKPKVQCHMQFNGSFACGYCLHPNSSITVLETVHSRSGIVVQADTSENTDARSGNAPEIFRRKKVMRYVRGTHETRTNKELRKSMKLAAESPHDHVMGSTGVSVLCNLKHFNVVFGFPIDYLHAILLGTVKRLVGYWLDSSNHCAPYYIGRAIARIDSRITTSITLPSGFRAPRPISDRAHWKGNEWRAFLLYFGLPVLMNILPSVYYDHFKKLVIAVYTLTKESITHDEIDDAHHLLQSFVWEYQDLYGEINMAYNVHITGHLAEVVAKTGPLWAYSAFPFETANGRLVGLATGTKGVATQITRKFIMTKGVSKLLRNNYNASENVLNYCCKIVGFNYLKHASKGENNETLLGKQFYFTLNDSQKKVFDGKDIQRRI